MGFDNVNVNVSGPVQPASTYKTKVLKGNHSFASQVTEPNMKYVIKHDFVLDGDVTIPANCILEFDGGSISGEHTLIGQNTIINSKEFIIFKNGIIIDGIWNCPVIYSTWFADITSDNNLKNLIALSSENIYNDIYIRPGNYSLSARFEGDEILFLKSNTHIHLDGTIQLQPNAYDRVLIFRIESVDNVTIDGSGIIQGDKDNHLSPTGESGHGISMARSNHVKIYGLTIKDCWGDGIAIGGNSGVPDTNVNIEMVTITNVSRNGISVVCADNFIISKCTFSKISRTDPKRAIDIEPNDGCFCINGVISDNYISECTYGILTTRLGNGYTKNILIKNNVIDCYLNDYSTLYARSITVFASFVSNVIIENNNIYNGGISCGGPSEQNKVVIKGNRINGRVKFVFALIEDNEFFSDLIELESSIFKENVINYDAVEYELNGGYPAVARGNSIVKDNIFNLNGSQIYKINCVVSLTGNNNIVTRNNIRFNDTTEISHYANITSNANNSIIIDNIASRHLNIADSGVNTLVYNTLDIPKFGNVRPTLYTKDAGFGFFDKQYYEIDFWDGSAWIDVFGNDPQAVSYQRKIIGRPGNFAGFDNNGGLIDSGKKPSDFEPVSQ